MTLTRLFMLLFIAIVSSCTFIERADDDDRTYIIDSVREGKKVDIKAMWEDSCKRPLMPERILEAVSFLDQNAHRAFNKIDKPEKVLTLRQLYKVQRVLIPRDKLFSLTEIKTLLILKKMLMGGTSSTLSYTELKNFLKNLLSLSVEISRILWLRLPFEEAAQNSIFSVPYYKLPDAIRNFIISYRNWEKSGEKEIINKTELDTALKNMIEGDFDLSRKLVDFLTEYSGKTHLIFEFFGILEGIKKNKIITSGFLNIPLVAHTDLREFLRILYIRRDRPFGENVNSIYNNYYRLSPAEQEIFRDHLVSFLRKTYNKIPSFNNKNYLTDVEIKRLIFILKELEILPGRINPHSVTRFFLKLKSVLYGAPLNSVSENDLENFWDEVAKAIDVEFELAGFFGARVYSPEDLIDEYEMYSPVIPSMNNWLSGGSVYIQDSMYLYRKHSGCEKSCVYFNEPEKELRYYFLSGQVLRAFDYNHNGKIDLTSPDEIGLDDEIISFSFTMANLLMGQEIKDKYVPDSLLQPAGEPITDDSSSFERFQNKVRKYVPLVVDNLLSNSVQDRALSLAELSEVVSRIAKVYTNSGYCEGVGKSFQNTVYMDENLKPPRKFLEEMHYRAAGQLLSSGVGNGELWWGGQDTWKTIDSSFGKDLPYSSFMKSISDYLLTKKGYDYYSPLSRDDCIGVGAGIFIADILIKKLASGKDSISYRKLFKYIYPALKRSYPDKSGLELKMILHFILQNKIDLVFGFKEISGLKKGFLVFKEIFRSSPENISVSELGYIVFQLVDRLTGVKQRN